MVETNIGRCIGIRGSDGIIIGTNNLFVVTRTIVIITKLVGLGLGIFIFDIIGNSTIAINHLFIFRRMKWSILFPVVINFSVANRPVTYVTAFEVLVRIIGLTVEKTKIVMVCTVM